MMTFWVFCMLLDPSMALRLGQPEKFACNGENTIFDIGMNNGADTEAYLKEGNCVVAVEADTDLVHKVNGKMESQLATGQLRIVNTVLSLSDEPTDAKVVFYQSKCTPEWNSMDKELGCRECSWKNMSKTEPRCEPVDLAVTTCSSLLESYGAPIYMKMDIEGAEIGCLTALEKISKGGVGKLPKFLSIELQDPQDPRLQLIHSFGYEKFKFVRQDVHPGSSGPWGQMAPDCKKGQAWRDFHGLVQQMTAVFNVTGTEGKGEEQQLCPSWEEGNGNGIWYDVHAMLG